MTIDIENVEIKELRTLRKDMDKAIDTYSKRQKQKQEKT